MREKLIKVYEELKDIIDNMYSEHEKGYKTSHILRSILEVMGNSFTDEDIKAEYNNMVAFRNFLLKRNVIDKEKYIRFYIHKDMGEPRTVIIVDDINSSELGRHIEIRIPSNLNRVKLGVNLISGMTFGFKHMNIERIEVYLKSISQLYQSYSSISDRLQDKTLKIYECNRLLHCPEIFDKLNTYDNLFIHDDKRINDYDLFHSLIGL